MNRKFVYQVGNKKKLYYDAWPTKYQGLDKCLEPLVVQKLNC